MQTDWQPNDDAHEPEAPSAVVYGLTVLIVILLVGGVVGAVSRSDSQTSARQRLAAARKATTNQQTLHFTTTVSVPLPGGSRLEESISGAVDFVTQEFEMQISVATLTETLRQLGNVGYLQASIFHLPNGAHWVKILPSDVTGGSNTVAASTPAAGLELLDTIVGTPVVVGKEAVGSVSTTHYRVTLNLQNTFKQIGQNESRLSPIIGNGVQALAGDSDLKHEPGDVWLDSAGRVRRLRYTFKLRVLGETVSEVETSDYSNFGASVRVTTPAAGDTVPFSVVKDQLAGLPRTPA
jgi:hypothetical protein